MRYYVVVTASLSAIVIGLSCLERVVVQRILDGQEHTSLTNYLNDFGNIVYTNEEVAREISAIWLAFIVVFIILYFFVTLGFIWVLNRRVMEPLVVLKRGILDIKEGKARPLPEYQGAWEFQEICDRFQSMSEQLMESEIRQRKLLDEKQKLLADISHDLKTPITVIQGYAKAICDGVVEPDQEKRYLHTIYTKAEALTGLINTFYDYSRLEHPQFALAKTRGDILEYIREYLADKYMEIELQGDSLEADVPDGELVMEYDQVQLQRVFENIINNSLRHNPKGTRIRFDVSGGNSVLKIVISDNGLGIPEEMQERIFEPFVVGDESRSERQGSGLGMAVAYKIVEAHGGTLRLLKESGEEKTVFEILLPYDADHESV